MPRLLRLGAVEKVVVPDQRFLQSLYIPSTLADKMEMRAPIVLLVCVAIGIISIMAFKDRSLRDRLMFRPESILGDKEWNRIFTSGLVHLDWLHLGFNLVALYMFGAYLEAYYGAFVFATVFVLSVVGGSLLSLFIHRNHDYSALGASGGVCGVIFASIFLIPGIEVGLLFLPYYMPGTLFAVLYLGLTFYAIRKGLTNVGHDAHFGGSFVGLLLASLIDFEICMQAPVVFVSSFIFCVFGIFYISRKSFSLGLPVFRAKRAGFQAGVEGRDYEYNRKKNAQKCEIDKILDRVLAHGIDGITASERAKLDEYSRRKGANKSG